MKTIGEKQMRRSIKRDRVAKYFGLIILVMILFSGLIIIKFGDTQPEDETALRTIVDFLTNVDAVPENLVDFRTVHLIIETEKDEYELGESIRTTIYVFNPTAEDVQIRSITNYLVDANSEYDPNPSIIGASQSPVGAYIKINANGRYTFVLQTFTPNYPGEFRITCLGVSKTVNVTGYKEVSLNTTGISLEIQTSQNEFKIGDQIEVYLVIRNRNLYPVKVPVYQEMTPSAVPLENPHSTMFVEWSVRYFEVEANSTRRTWTIRVTLRRTHYEKYWYADGQEAYIEFEVAPN